MNPLNCSSFPRQLSVGVLIGATLGAAAGFTASTLLAPPLLIPATLVGAAAGVPLALLAASTTALVWHRIKASQGRPEAERDSPLLRPSPPLNGNTTPPLEECERDYATTPLATGQFADDDYYKKLAVKISKNEAFINKLNLSDEQLELLAPHLTHCDFQDLDDDRILFLLEKAINLTSISISSSTIQRLPNLPNCIALKCRGCRALQALPELPNCKYLDCQHCFSLEVLPELNCEIVNCSNCTSLRYVTKLSNCHHLLCNKCPALPALPELFKCEFLKCIDCTSLLGLPDLSKCLQVNCAGCTALERIGDLSACQHFNGMGCTALRVLPNALPNCGSFYCEDCPGLNDLPQLPANCRAGAFKNYLSSRPLNERNPSLKLSEAIMRRIFDLRVRLGSS